MSEDRDRQRRAVAAGEEPGQAPGRPGGARDLFAHKADGYDRRDGNLTVVERIGAAIVAGVDLSPDMALMDFGSGTGLLLEQLAPHVGHITAVDVSPAMHGKLREKLPSLPCEVELLTVDLEREELDARYDGIVTSLTLHHIRDVPALLAKLAPLVRPGGFLAAADVDAEDGNFHEPGTEGVHHHGFERDAIVADVRAAGFTEVRIMTAGAYARAGREYPVFLLTARR